MKYMIIVKQDADKENIHQTILELMESYQFELYVIFFTGNSASLFKNINADLLKQYKNKADIYDVRLLVCGRATEEQNIEKEQLVGVEISGYTELAICIAQAEKVISF